MSPRTVTPTVPHATPPLSRVDGGQELRTVAVRDLEPAIDNPRGHVDPKDPTILELAESIRQVGILQAPVVVPALDGDGFVIVMGHRRVVAAMVAELDEIEVLVRTDLSAEELSSQNRREAMLVENLHREDLSPAQRARGFQDLLDLGLSQRDVADRCGVNQSTISKSVAILELPDAIQKTVGETIHQSLVPKLLKLKDHPKALAAAAKGGDEWRIDNAIRDVEAAQKVKDLKAKAADKGWKCQVVKGWSHDAPKGLRRIGAARYGETTVDVPVAAHRKEPCHRAVIFENRNPELVEYCAVPERHAAKGASDLKAAKPTKQAAVRRPSVKETKAQRDCKAASARREKALTAFFAKGKTPAAGKLVDVLAMHVIARAWADWSKVALRLLGVEAPKGGHRNGDLEKWVAENPDKAALAALAIAVGKGHLDASHPGRQWASDGDVDLTYVFLEQLGYELDPFERRQLGSKAPAAATALDPGPELDEGVDPEPEPEATSPGFADTVDDEGAPVGPDGGELDGPSDGAETPTDVCPDCGCSDEHPCDNECLWMETQGKCSNCVDEPPAVVGEETIEGPTVTVSQKRKLHHWACSCGEAGRNSTLEYAIAAGQSHLDKAHDGQGEIAGSETAA